LKTNKIFIKGSRKKNQKNKDWNWNNQNKEDSPLLLVQTMLFSKYFYNLCHSSKILTVILKKIQDWEPTKYCGLCLR